MAFTSYKHSYPLENSNEVMRLRGQHGVIKGAMGGLVLTKIHLKPHRLKFWIRVPQVVNIIIVALTCHSSLSSTRHTQSKSTCHSIDALERDTLVLNHSTDRMRDFAASVASVQHRPYGTDLNPAESKQKEAICLLPA
ncbi:hypothetical protein RRF57_006230 [Xylaria bambusicola]|uniref:Uncharacterized protein n=1 Tax=Xylaria bambusicola TaxID=326684 RepID=A0AAN7YYJ9_9PEZI